MEKFIYHANHLAKYRAKMAVKALNRDGYPMSVSDLAALLSLAALLLL